VPIGQGFEKSNLSSWLGALDNEELEVILVYDGNDPDEKENLEQLLTRTQIGKKKLLYSSSRNPGGTRNIGLQAVTGEWFCFCDADDIPEIQNILKVINEVAKQTQVIVGQYKKKTPMENQVVFSSDTNSLEGLLVELGLWRILFRASDFRTYKFPDSKMGEDQAFVIFSSLTTRDIQFSKYNFYNYFYSVTDQLTSNPQKFEQLALSISFALKHLECSSSQIDSESRFRFEILTRMLLTHIIKGNQKVESFGLFKLLWNRFPSVSFARKLFLFCKVVRRVLVRNMRLLKHKFDINPTRT
jgi:glycosyltransferase involved in cell wall biosynthesis